MSFTTRDASVSAAMTTLVFDPSARRLEDGRVLIGGHPARLLRLTPAGAPHGRRLAGGCGGRRERGRPRLADRLIAAGLAHPRPAPGAVTPADVAVVIPARDRAGDAGRVPGAGRPAAARS